MDPTDYKYHLAQFILGERVENSKKMYVHGLRTSNDVYDHSCVI